MQGTGRPQKSYSPPTSDELIETFSRTGGLKTSSRSCAVFDFLASARKDELRRVFGVVAFR